MFLEMGVADAYGIAFEFVKNPQEHGLVNDGKTFQQNPRYPELKPSQYTDDTLRSIATLHVVCYDPDGLYDPICYIKAIQHIYSIDQRPGWSKRFQKYLEDGQKKSAESFMLGITQRRNSNGAIMGCLPVAYLESPVAVKLAAAAQAISTHSISTIQYAQALALMAHYFISGGDSIDGMKDFLREHVEDVPEVLGFGGLPYKPNNPHPFSTANVRNVPIDMTAQRTANAVYYQIAYGAGKSLTELMKSAVVLGGDTDSVAALTVGIASLAPKLFPNDLDKSLIDGLDDGEGSEILRHYDETIEIMTRRWRQSK